MRNFGESRRFQWVVSLSWDLSYRDEQVIRRSDECNSSLERETRRRRAAGGGPWVVSCRAASLPSSDFRLVSPLLRIDRCASRVRSPVSRGISKNQYIRVRGGEGEGGEGAKQKKKNYSISCSPRPLLLPPSSFPPLLFFFFFFLP